jgi:hypothetical protein
MKKLLAATTALVALPVLAQAQSLQPGGFYIGAEGGINWLLNTSSNANVTVGGLGSANGTVNINPNLGWNAGGMIGYDFIGPRIEIEGNYRDNTGTLKVPGIGGNGVGFDFNQTSVMATLL